MDASASVADGNWQSACGFDGISCDPLNRESNPHRFHRL